VCVCVCVCVLAYFVMLFLIWSVVTAFVGTMDFNAKTKEGDNAIEFCLRNKHYEVAQLLNKHGAKASKTGLAGFAYCYTPPPQNNNKIK